MDEPAKCYQHDAGSNHFDRLGVFMAASIVDKVCRRCQSVFSATHCEACGKHRTAAYRLNNKEKVKAAREAWILSPSPKKCRACGGSYVGVSGCVPCTKKKRADYYARNKETLLAKQKLRARDHEKERARYAVYSANNQEKLKAAGAAYRAANREAVRARSAAWFAKNKGARALYEHKRRALLANCGGTVSRDIAEKLMNLQKGKCACCCVDLKKTSYHLDHVMPLSKGGLHVDNNIQLLCPPCNRSKSAKMPHEFMRERGFLL